MSETKPRTTPGYLETVVIAVLAAGAAVYGYHHYFPPTQIKTFDLKGYARSQAALVQAGEITNEQFKENLNKVDAMLDAEKSIILLKDVVMKNGVEIPAK